MADSFIFILQIYLCRSGGGYDEEQDGKKNGEAKRV